MLCGGVTTQGGTERRAHHRRRQRRGGGGGPEAAVEPGTNACVSGSFLGWQKRRVFCFAGFLRGARLRNFTLFSLRASPDKISPLFVVVIHNPPAFIAFDHRARAVFACLFTPEQEEKWRVRRQGDYFLLYMGILGAGFLGWQIRRFFSSLSFVFPTCAIPRV